MLYFLQRQLAIANSAEYAGKKEWFFPLKQELLKRYAKNDGYDKQYIHKPCWECNGSGNNQWDEICNSCNGGGIYSTKTYYLNRWLIGDKIYHVPQTELPAGNQQNIIEGRIIHEKSYTRIDGRNALIILMLRYKPFTLLRLWLAFKLQINNQHKWSNHYLYVSGTARLFVIVAGLFAGWMTYKIDGSGLFIAKRGKVNGLSHMLWVLQAYK